MTSGSQRRKRRRAWVQRRSLPGASPGTIAIDPEALRPVVTVLAYGPDGMVEGGVEDVRGLRSFLERWPVTWVNVDGLGDAATLGALGEFFQLHRLALEDVVNVHQRPKVDPYGPHVFVVLRMPHHGETLETEQFSIFLGRNFVLSFQERPGDCLEPVRERIRRGIGRIRESGPDYLAYALLDAVVDGYFPLLESFGEQMENLEEEILTRPGARVVSRLHHVKSDLLTLRRAIWPLRETVNVLAREESPLIGAETRVYLRDCYDHAVQLIDLVETYREIGSSLMDVYLSSVSQRTNEIMKVLTMMATIFIPLTFIAGVYGMNFHPEASPLNMPELGWYWGYPFALTLMAAVATIMIGFFRRKGWLGGRGPGERDGGREESGRTRDGP